MTNFGIGCGLLTASFVLIVFYVALVKMLGFFPRKGTVIKPYLIEEDELNCKKKYSEPRIEYSPKHEFRMGYEFENFAYALLIVVPVAIVATSGFGIANLCSSFAK